MKLEVGMYVRTKEGIHKIYRIDNNKTKYKYLYKLKKQDGDGCINCGVLSSEDIIGEPSFDIIDLIQPGDYVNGTLVEDMFEKTNYADKSIKLKGSGDYWYNEHIKSIVTKEQFEAIKYEIK